jgi:hypothetical protein
MIEDLTDKNIIAYMIMTYDNPQCIDFEEFEDDMKVPKYIKRLINRYLSVGELKERLILNHIISFYNVFGVDAATRILFFKMDESDYSVLKTFLVYLNVMPGIVEMIRGKNIFDSDIPISQEVAKRLREL